MRLPNGENAVVEIAKLTDQCLNPSHPRGRHKARVFAARLGFMALHAESLQTLVRAAAAERQDAGLVGADSFGTRYLRDFEVHGPTGFAKSRSAWIIRVQEDFSRLASCYVL